VTHIKIEDRDAIAKALLAWGKKEKISKGVGPRRKGSSMDKIGQRCHFNRQEKV